MGARNRLECTDGLLPLRKEWFSLASGPTQVVRHHHDDSRNSYREEIFRRKTGPDIRSFIVAYFWRIEMEPEMCFRVWVRGEAGELRLFCMRPGGTCTKTVLPRRDSTTTSTSTSSVI
eukprot:3523551-Rhodomonas_salina.2